MPIFDGNLPYTNLHELNNDWIVKTVKDVKDKTDEIDTAVSEAKEYSENAKTSEDNAKISEENALEYYQNVQSYTENLSNQVSQNTLNIATNSGRIDGFTQLRQGSTTGDAELMDIRVAVDGTVYPTAGDSVRTQLKDKCDKTVVSFNKFNPDKITQGYVSYQTGAIVSNANFYTSDFIPVNAGERYKIENTGNNQVALYDSTKTYTTGYVNSNSFNLTDIPSGSAYVRFCLPVANLGNAHFYRNDEYVPLHFWDSQTTFKQENVAEKLSSDIIEYSITVSTVADLCQAVNNLILTTGYHYTIYLNEGTYTLDYSAIQTLTNSTYGIMLTDNVDLIGLGAGATIITDLTGQSSTVQSLISPINIKGNIKLKNLTVVAINCRYAVHADNSNNITDNKQYIEDCIFIHEGNSDNGWAYPSAWGAGTSSGSEVYFKNCTFISPWKAFTLHNNVNFTKPSKNIFDNCHFVCTDNKMSMGIESLNSGVKDQVILKGCTFNQLLDCRRQNNTVVSNDFVIEGYGCSPIASNFYYTDGKTYVVKIAGQSERIYNSTGSNIPSLTPLKYDNGLLVPLSASDTKEVCVGVTAQPIDTGEVGVMQYKGYLNVSTVPGVYAIGQKIGIVNGSLAVVNNNDYIGVVTYINTLYNRKYMLFKNE